MIRTNFQKEYVSHLSRTGKYHVNHIMMKDGSGYVEVGANWALQNQWHDASKELPEDGIKVIVLTEKGNAAINSVYTFNGNRR